jgi:copper chaperone CopZ
MELQYNNLCCEKCVRDIKSALFKFPGIPFPASICLLMRLTFAVDPRFLL